MTPIEKAWIKADAMSVLGLRGSETAHEIRQAWKRKAFEVHPDQSGGEVDEFLRAKAAFELLSAENSEISTTSEPEVQTRVTPRRPAQVRRSFSGTSGIRP